MIMISPLIVFFLLMAVLFGVGTSLLCALPRLKQAAAKWAVMIAGVGCLLILFFYLVTAGPYVWALHLESKWKPAQPESKSELESHLALYTEERIEPGESGWGANHQLKSGERMIRYSLLGAPLDVVYTSDDRLVAIYTSYE